MTTPVVGDRLVVTHVATPDDEPHLYVGATGVVAQLDERHVAVEWDDARLARLDVALLVGRDEWTLGSPS